MNSRGLLDVVAASATLDPPECRRCLEVLARPADVLCDRCLPFVVDAGPQCQRCAAPVGPHLAMHSDCPRCRAESWAFASVRSLGPYDLAALQRLVLRAKRAGGTSAAAALARLWSRHFVRSAANPQPSPQRPLAVAQIDVVVPVPRHWRRRLAFGAPGSERLAEAIARSLRRPLLLRAVRQVRACPRQSGLSATERRRNLVDAFAIGSDGPIEGSRVLLVDDILTTGQTAHRVARVLCEHGAISVEVAVMARGVGETIHAASMTDTPPRLLNPDTNAESNTELASRECGTDAFR